MAAAMARVRWPTRCARRSWPLRAQAIPIAARYPKWTPYMLPNRETILFDLPSRLANDPRGEERKLFAKVPYIQQGT